jgi:hypothetical protein
LRSNQRSTHTVEHTRMLLPLLLQLLLLLLLGACHHRPISPSHL